MTFSVMTKNELARIIPDKRCCQLAELSALLRMDGTIQISANQQVAFYVTTDNAAVARKTFRLIKSLFDLPVEIMTRRQTRLKKQSIYRVRIPLAAPTEVLQALGIIDASRRVSYRLKNSLVGRQCCRRAYLRGAFLASGSVNNPEGTYHLEIITGNETYAQQVCQLIRKTGLGAKVSMRKNWYVIYLKESDQIVEFLNLIGAHSALLKFENTRIVKDMRNQVNRLVNCETANLDKTITAAVRQVGNILVIKDQLGLEKLPPQLRELAELRLQYPDSSLKELGELLEPRVGKSGVNHRMRRIEEIADRLRAGLPGL
ncbi:MAG: DNA-binding protein WhiA [Firmicutes bacterium]|nr:DNA-binding protein WhiA [Bacillota bacterium]